METEYNHLINYLQKSIAQSVKNLKYIEREISWMIFEKNFRYSHMRLELMNME